MSAVVESAAAAAVRRALARRRGSVPVDELGEVLEVLTAPRAVVDALEAAGEVATVVVDGVHLVALTLRGAARARQSRDGFAFNNTAMG